VTALRAELVEDAARLEGHAGAWDGLADAASRPFCSAAWLLAWWRHARPARSTLAIVLVWEGEKLVGAAPAFAQSGPPGVVRWRPLAAQTCQRVEPFALPGREGEVAAAITEVLAARRPAPTLLSFEGIGETSPWPRLLADAWPGRRRARVVALSSIGALAIDLRGHDFDGWFRTKSSHFRQRLRRQRRLASERGGAFRLADGASAAHDIEGFLRVHGDRWAGRGGSRAVTPRVAAMLRSAGPGLVASGRLRVWSLDVGEEIVASSLVFVAGSQHGYWLNGFDEAHADLEPSKISILQVIEDAFACGAEGLDLGEGAFAYKQRFADPPERLVHVAVLPSSPRRPLALAAIAPGRARHAVAARLTQEQKARVRGLIRIGRS